MQECGLQRMPVLSLDRGTLCVTWRLAWKRSVAAMCVGSRIPAKLELRAGGKCGEQLAVVSGRREMLPL